MAAPPLLMLSKVPTSMNCESTATCITGAPGLVNIPPEQCQAVLGDSSRTGCPGSLLANQYITRVVPGAWMPLSLNPFHPSTTFKTDSCESLLAKTLPYYTIHFRNDLIRHYDCLTSRSSRSGAFDPFYFPYRNKVLTRLLVTLCCRCARPVCGPHQTIRTGNRQAAIAF